MAVAYTDTCVNYIGDLFQLGQTDTPFLNMIGGLNGGVRVVNSTEFAMSQYWQLGTAAQPEISEADSMTAPTATTITRNQATNVVQIFQEQVSVSYSKLGNANAISGVALTGETQPVRNELDFQIEAHMKKIAKNANYTFLHGAYAAATNNTTAVKTRGVVTAITTNAIAQTSTPQLTKAMLDELFLKCADNGMDFANAALFVNGYNKQIISGMYGDYAEQDRNIGGKNIKQIETDFGNVMVVYEPTMAGTVALLDMGKIKPVAKDIPGKGQLFYEPLSKVGAGEQGQIYGELGIDYANEAFHGKITGLKSSAA